MYFRVTVSYLGYEVWISRNIKKIKEDTLFFSCNVCLKIHLLETAIGAGRSQNERPRTHRLASVHPVSW
jgi:hypothetical protein